MCHDSLENYYRTHFVLGFLQKIDLGSLDNLMPYERDAYVNMLNDHLQQQELEMKKLQNKH